MKTGSVCCYEFIKLNTSAWVTSDLMVPALTTDGISVECQVFI